MRPIADARMDALEDATMEAVKELRACLAYKGSDPRYFRNGRLASGMISAYARIRASETNRMAVELAAERVMPPALPAGPPTQKRALKG